MARGPDTRREVVYVLLCVGAKASQGGDIQRAKLMLKLF